MNAAERFFLSSLTAVTFTTAAVMTWAQPTTLMTDIARNRLTWTWTQGMGGPVEKWLIRCGPASGTYNLQLTVTDPAARSVPVLQVIPDVGKYFCAVAAQNSAATSPLSSEVTIVAGKVVDAGTFQTLQTR